MVSNPLLQMWHREGWVCDFLCRLYACRCVNDLEQLLNSQDMREREDSREVVDFGDDVGVRELIRLGGVLLIASSASGEVFGSWES